MKKKNWIVLANGACARFFRIDSPGVFTELESDLHPESRLKSSDLVSDRPGRAFGRVGTVRHALTKSVTPKQKEEEVFAREVMEHLEKSFLNGELGSFYLAASPSFLGLLRGVLSENLNRSLLTSVAKDLTHIKTNSLNDYFPMAK